MRAVLVEILLALVVAFCLAFLLISGSLGFDRIVLAGIGLLLVSSLFAAISALGPKYEPTPFLTPMMAGTMTAIIATTLVFASSARLPQAESSSQPATSMQASLEPTPAAPADDSVADVPMDAPSVRTVEPGDQPDDLGTLMESPGESAFGSASSPLLAPTPMEPVDEDVFFSETVEEEAPPLFEEPALPTTPEPTLQAPDGQATQAEPPPTQLVQSPQPAAPDPNAPLQLNPVVGSSSPSAAPAQPPAVIPPLPRIRPR